MTRGTLLRIDWREAHKWWSSWALLLHILMGTSAAWGAVQDIIPWWAFIMGSIGLSLAVWVLSHLNQPGLSDDGAPPEQAVH